MRTAGGIILVLAGLVLALKGLWVLLKYKKYLFVLGHLIFLVGAPFIFFEFIELIQDWHTKETTKLWVVIPVAFLIPVWLTWGFFINKNAENVVQKQKELNRKI